MGDQANDYQKANDFGNIKFDSLLEVDLYDLLNDFELTSMIKSIESQVWVTPKRRVDFVLTMTNGESIYLEVDGPMHDQNNVKERDKKKD